MSKNRTNSEVSFSDDTMDYYSNNKNTGSNPNNNASNGGSAKLQKTSHNAFDSWEAGPRYNLTELLGKGSYGQVAKATDR